MLKSVVGAWDAIANRKFEHGKIYNSIYMAGYKKLATVSDKSDRISNGNSWLKLYGVL